MSKDIGILDPVTHARLIDGLPEIVRQSKVHEAFIKTSAIGKCDDEDIDFLQNYVSLKSRGLAGYCKVGGKGASRKLNYMAGAFIRNYIDARVHSLESCIELGETLSPTVLIVPDFCLDTNDGKPMVGWKVQQVYDFLVTRMSLGKTTILYAKDLDLMTRLYGESVVDFITDNYIMPVN